MLNSNLAPIVLFVYNRPWHTQKTVEALKKNELAEQSELFIFSDEAKHKDAQKSVDEVREYVDKIDGFKKVTIIKRDKNWGLANSIIDGVTKIVNKYGKIIVLEDDLVTSPYFLKFMNEALEFYKNEKKVWHVSGWNYPIARGSTESGDVFLWRTMNCWGWATWSDRWKYFEKDVDKLINSFSKAEIKRFNLDGVGYFWDQVILNQKGVINTWAVFWYASIFKNNGFCLNPVQTYVDNIGHDGSGENCLNEKNYVDSLNQKASAGFLSLVTESEKYVIQIKKYLKKSVLYKIKRFFSWK